MEKSRVLPNFFIVGGPRCGTTSMSRYLGDHPEIFFSTPKELNFFNTDFSDKARGCLSEEEYLEFFNSASQYEIVGEGTPWYLYSKEAVGNILEFNKDAKFIVCIRNPVDMFYSLHGKLFFTGDEDVKDPVAAWELQSSRKQGHSIPKHCSDPKKLFYRDVCSLGAQIEKLYALVDSKNIKVVFLEDLIKEPLKIYKDVLKFLEVEYDDRTDFHSQNSHKSLRWVRLARVGQFFPRVLVKIALNLKPYLGIKKYGLRKALINLSSTRGGKRKVRSSIQNKVAQRI